MKLSYLWYGSRTQLRITSATYILGGERWPCNSEICQMHSTQITCQSEDGAGQWDSEFVVLSKVSITNAPFENYISNS